MGNNLVKLGVAIVVLAVSAGATAAQRYISDELSVNVRRGPSTSYGISELLEAGTRVQTLEQTNGWTRIRTPGGEKGYVLTRLLSTQPAASDRIEAMQVQLQQLQQENESLRHKLTQTRPAEPQPGTRASALAAQNKALKAELQRIKRLSANAIQLSKTNQKLRQNLLAAQSELERLQAQNKVLSSQRAGMKIGALILACGVILGLVLPLFRRRRNKSSWGSL